MTAHQDLIIQRDVIAEKDALLCAVLSNVPFDGWSIKALTEAAQSLTIDDQAVMTLFPGGITEVRFWLDEWADRQMEAALSGIELGTIKLQQRVAAAMKARLAALGPHREAVRRAVSARFSPAGIGHGVQAVYRTVDAIWYLIGDRSVDFSFYTKRATLASVHAASVLYWLNDSSENSVDTQEFIDRRLMDAVRLPKAVKQQAKRAVRFFAAPFDLLRIGVRQ